MPTGSRRSRYPYSLKAVLGKLTKYLNSCADYLKKLFDSDSIRKLPLNRG